MSKNNEVVRIINISPFNRHPWGQAALAELKHPDIEIPDTKSEINSLVLGIFSGLLFHCLSKEEQLKFINSKSKDAMRFKKYFAGHCASVGEAVCNELLDSTLDTNPAPHLRPKIPPNL
jgi:hypothetical protein